MKTHENKTEKIGYKDILQQKEYLKIILAGLINRFGDSIDVIAFTWLVYAITGSAAWSAAVAAVNQLPSVFLQPFAGALVEGMEKKRLMVATDIIRGAITVGTAALYLGNRLSPWVLLGFTLANSTVEAFRLPASLAITPKVLEEKYYEFGTSLNSTLSRAIELIGLGAAGIVIGIFGAGAAIAIDGASFFGSAWILSFLHVKEGSLRKGKLPIKEYMATLKDGFCYLKGQPVIRNFCLFAIFNNAITVPLSALQMPLIQEVLGQGEGLLSVFSIALTVGMGIGSFLYPFIRPLLSVRALFVGCGLLMGAGTYSYTLAEWFPAQTAAIYGLAIAASILIGISVSVLNSALSVQFMKAVRPEYLARVGSIFNAGASAAMPAASFLVSGITAFCPVAEIFRLTALFCVIIYLAFALLKVRLE